MLRSVLVSPSGMSLEWPHGDHEAWRRDHLGETVMMEERSHGMLRASGRTIEKLTWPATARAMVASHEDWSAWDTTTSDGLDHVAVWETEERAGSTRCRSILRSI